LRFRVRDLPTLMRTGMGRHQIRRGAFMSMWPFLLGLARIHRRVLARDPRVVAVIGSLGKTTTTRTVTGVLCGPDHPVCSGNCLSHVAMSLLKMRRRDAHAVLEVGVRSRGEMSRYASVVRPDIAVVTSIASEHNTSFGSLDVTRAEKAQMVEALPPTGVAVLNGDDPNVLWMKNRTRARVVTYGFGETNDIRAEAISYEDWPDGTRLRLCVNGKTFDARTRLVGKPSLAAVLAAIATGTAEGVPLPDILERVEAIPPVPGRLEPVRLDCGAVILRDDFKSAIETVETALQTLAAIPARRRTVVIGDVTEPQGPLGPLYRGLGARIAEVADRAIFLSGGNDTRLRSGATGAGMRPELVTKAGHDTFRVPDILRDELGPGDVVLIKGRSDQRLDRITLILQGRTVGCRIPSCRAREPVCHDCPALEEGWGDSRVMVF
jgi:UDP-N-acetylmuramoyl-tripeptide--D-alanyl-D-alanine ligase